MMAQVHKTVIVAYSAEQMFILVDKVEEYANFLPWCAGADVKQRDADKLIATLLIDYHGIRQSFTTENKNVPAQSIKMHLLDGPFKHLDGMWTFKPLAVDACKIEFNLTYAFSSKILEKLIGPVFNIITNNFVEAFCKRAQVVYGKSE